MRYSHCCISIAAVMLIAACAAQRAPVAERGSAVVVEVFVTPHCPYGQDALAQLIELAIETEGCCALEVHYIAEQTTLGRPESLADFSSRDGPGEVFAGVVAVVIKRLYPERYLEYLFNCVSNPDGDWRAAARKTGVDPDLVAAYALTEEALGWHADNIASAKARGITRTPSLFFAGEAYTRPAIDPDRLRMALCRNLDASSLKKRLCADLPECIDASDCAAPAGALALCEQGCCDAPFEDKVALTVLTSRLLHPVHLEPSLERLRHLIPSAEVCLLDIESPEGAALATDLGAATLPAFVFASEAKKCRNYEALLASGFHARLDDRVAMIGCPIPAPLAIYGAVSYEDAVQPAYTLSADVRATPLQAVGLDDAAEALYAVHLAEHPDDPRAYSNLAALYMKQKRWEQALDTLTKAIEADSEYEKAYQNLERVYAALELDEGRAFTVVREGWLLLAKGSWDAAASRFATALEVSSDTPTARHGLGTALLRLEHYTEAVHHLQTAHARDPGNWRVLNSLAGAHWRMGASAEAIHAYRRASALEPSIPHVIGNLAAALHETGQIGAAIRLLEGLPELCVENPDLGARLVWLYCDAERWHPAAETGVRFVENTDDAPAPLLYWTGKACLASGKLSQAQTHFRHCSAMQIADSELRYALARALVEAQLPSEAKRTLEDLIAASPGHARAHAYLATIDAATDGDDEAVQKHTRLAGQFGFSDGGWPQLYEYVARYIKPY